MFRSASLKQRVGVGVVAVLTLLTVTALPGLTAPSGAKYYMSSVTVSQATQPVNAGDQNEIFLVTIKNTSPKQSSSNIGSVSVIVPSQFDLVDAWIDPSSSNGDNSGATVTIDSQGTTCQAGTDQQVNACNIAQVKSQKTIVLAIKANVTSSNLRCGSNDSGAWLVAANTGTALNGDAFTRDPAQTSDPITRISNTCTLTFDPAPVNAAVGASIPVGVKVLDAVGNEVTTDRTVELSVPGATVTGSPDTTYRFTFSVSGSSAGDYTATASSTEFTPITADFTLFDPASSISGQKWRDHDNDGQRDAAERGLQYWTIGAYQGGTLVASDITDENGNYMITGLSAGQTYTVCEIAPAEDPGFEYRGWIQSVPNDPDDVCADVARAEPNGYTVTFPAGNGSTVPDVDFFNVRTITIPGTITVGCNPAPPPEGTVYTVGDGTTEPKATVTVYPDACKPGVYVFESYWDPTTHEQVVFFYPVLPQTNVAKVPITENLEWVIDGDKAQRTLYYDDFVKRPDGSSVPERKMLFCKIANGQYAGMPDPVAPDTDPHTTCLMSTTETASASGVLRLDTIKTLVDGVVRTR